MIWSASRELKPPRLCDNPQECSRTQSSATRRATTEKLLHLALRLWSLAGSYSLQEAGKDERPDTQVTEKIGSANGIRTRVTAVRGRCPRPLDDSAGELCECIRSFRTARSTLLFSHGT